MNTKTNSSGINYEPNSFNGIKENPHAKGIHYSLEGEIGSFDYDEDYYSQAGDFYRLLSEEERTRLIQTIAGSLGQVQNQQIKERQVMHFYRADPEYGRRIAEAIDVNI